MSMRNKKAFDKLMKDNRENYIKNRAQEDGFKTAVVLFCWTLHDKHGYGTKRLEKLIDEVQELSDALVEGYANAKELLEQLEEETKIRIFK